MEEKIKVIQELLDKFYTGLETIEKQHHLTVKIIDLIKVQPKFTKTYDMVQICFIDPKAIHLNIREEIVNLFGRELPYPYGAPVSMTYPCAQND